MSNEEDPNAKPADADAPPEDQDDDVMAQILNDNDQANAEDQNVMVLEEKKEEKVEIKEEDKKEEEEKKAVDYSMEGDFTMMPTKVKKDEVIASPKHEEEKKVAPKEEEFDIKSVKDPLKILSFYAKMKKLDPEKELIPYFSKDSKQQINRLSHEELNNVISAYRTGTGDNEKLFGAPVCLAVIRYCCSILGLSRLYCHRKHGWRYKNL